MNLIDAIRARHSVRTFDGRGLTDAERAEAEKLLAQHCSGMTVKLISSDTGTFRPSTYGVVRGARDFLLLGYGPTDEEALRAGMAMERVVLGLQRIGLSTCWIASTFRHTVFDREAGFPADRPLRIVIPVGHAARRRSLIDAVAHTLARSSSRRPSDRLFFTDSVLYNVAGTDRFYLPLSLMRLAPSSVNSQPWRAIVDTRAATPTVDFFCATSTPLSMLDMGIGLCHFAVGTEAMGLTGGYEKRPTHSDGGDWRYVCSWVTAEGQSAS